MWYIPTPPAEREPNCHKPISLTNLESGVKPVDSTPADMEEAPDPTAGAERLLGRSLGKFQIEAVVGAGGFAWVYRALDPDLGVPVAVKVLKPHFAGDPQFEQRFRQE